MTTAPSRKRARIGWATAAVLLALAAAAASFFIFLRSGEDPRSGSALVEEPGLFRIADEPTEYRIVYRVEDRAGGDLAISTDNLWMRRPFEGRFEVWSGEPLGDERISVRVSSFGRLAVSSAGAERSVFAVVPAPPAGDRRLASSLEAAVDGAIAEAREFRRVAGRLCRVYRFRGLPGEATLGPLAAAGDELSDVCIDGHGLVLEEVGYIEGRIVSRRVAAHVEEDPSLRAALFETGEPTRGVREGGGSLRAVDPQSRPPGRFWELHTAPEGFERRGRYAVVPPQVGFEDPFERRFILTATVDVWVRGPDVLTVEVGQTLEGGDPFADDPLATRVEAGALGTAEFALTLRGAEVRAKLGGGGYVRLAGTVPPQLLLELARAMREVEGGGLIYLDEPPARSSG